MALGHILLHARTTFLRVTSGTILSPTSFFAISNYAVWAGNGGMYPHTLAGLAARYTAVIPFYRNDLLSTALVAGIAFGLPAFAGRLRKAEPQPVYVSK
jgi:hypothetical protein